MIFRRLVHHDVWFLWPVLTVERWTHQGVVTAYVWCWGVEVEWRRHGSV